MKRIGLIALLAVAVLAQTSLLPFIRPLGVVPDVVLVVVVLIALADTTRWALGLALTAGLVLDLTSGVNFGLWTGLLVLEVLTAAYVRQAGIEVDGLAVPAVMVVAGSLVMTVLILVPLVGSVAHWPVDWILTKLGAELVINLLVVVAARPLIRLTSDGTVRG